MSELPDGLVVRPMGADDLPATAELLAAAEPVDDTGEHLDAAVRRAVEAGATVAEFQRRRGSGSAWIPPATRSACSCPGGDPQEGPAG